MLSCKEATERMSQAMERKLSFGERQGLRLHLLICRGCRATAKHLAFLHAATAAWRQEHSAHSTQQGDLK